MGLEIERKFLVKGKEYKKLGRPVPVRQGFLNMDKDSVVRVRIIGDHAFLSIKAAVSAVTRTEFEYEIPLCDGKELLAGFCKGAIIEKSRYFIQYKGHKWEVDEFHGDNLGLVVAEIELEREDQPFEKPAWVGDEVTGDERYYNVNLVKKPYKDWQRFD